MTITTDHLAIVLGVCLMLYLAVGYGNVKGRQQERKERGWYDYD